jgi:8-oxo-dGTP diphosphatase
MMVHIMKRVHVVAGIIFSSDSEQVLIARRPNHLHKGGFWEFPGGKLEFGESELQALRRELKEELNIEFARAKPFQEVSFDYPEKQLHLSFWSVFDVQNVTEVEGLEGQEWAWVRVKDLIHYKFPEANSEIVKRLVRS